MNRIYFRFRHLGDFESFRGSAISGCIVRTAFRTTAACLLAGFAVACQARALRTVPADIFTAPAPSYDEHYCAWYGHHAGELLYFGQSAFWSAHRASGGRPSADLDRAGSVLIGRFDLAGEELLPPLDVTVPGDRSGVWDVFAHPNGRIYFTTYFESAGFVDPETGAARRFPEAGLGLNEIAQGPGENMLVSRYGSGSGDGSGDRDGSEENGAVVVLDPDGRVVDEFPLTSPAGFIAAPKTVAYDRLRDEIWVTTDLLPLSGASDGDIRHDAYRLDGRGVEIARVASPEVQFVAFAADGTGYRAEVDGDGLWLVIVPPGPKDSRDPSLRIPLDQSFSSEFDFVQDIQFSADQRAVITRWSGWVHVVDPTGSLRSLQLPAFEPRGLYYTAALRNQRLCATHCGDVSVVCDGLDPGR